VKPDQDTGEIRRGSQGVGRAGQGEHKCGFGPLRLRLRARWREQNNNRLLACFVPPSALPPPPPRVCVSLHRSGRAGWPFLTASASPHPLPVQRRTTLHAGTAAAVLVVHHSPTPTDLLYHHHHSPLHSTTRLALWLFGREERA
jgi:hypothetical protein